MTALPLAAAITAALAYALHRRRRPRRGAYRLIDRLRPLAALHNEENR